MTIMERKYYLRGLGLGIVVTAVIMGVALSGGRRMTDEEIIARAKELGLVENTVLADGGDTEQDAEEQSGLPEDTALTAPQETAEDLDITDVMESADDPAEAAREQEEPMPAEDGAVPQEETLPEDGEAVPGDQYATPGAPQEADISDAAPETPDASSGVEKVIVINSGDGSYTVAKKLEAAGVVTSAENFDTFLCANGYDKRLRTGEFSIPADASDEQIARIVTGAE